MSHFQALKIGSMIAGMVIAGCQTQATRVVEPEWKSRVTDNSFNADVFSVKRKSDDKVGLVLDINFVSKSPAHNKSRYRVRWMDGSGHTIDSITSIWRDLSLSAYEKYSVSHTAPSLSVKDYAINLED